MNRIPTSQPRNRKSATRERARLHHGPTEGKCSRLLLIRLVFIAFSPIMIDIIAHLHPSCTPALTTRVFHNKPVDAIGLLCRANTPLLAYQRQLLLHSIDPLQIREEQSPSTVVGLHDDSV